MNDHEKRTYQMFVRVKNFGISNIGDFAPTSVGGKLIALVEGITNEIEAHTSSQVSGIGTARQGTKTRAQARADLRDNLEGINRTARAMADIVPGLDNKFRLPRNMNDQQLLATARSFVVDVVPFSAHFIAHELSDDFTGDLDSDIAALENAIDTQSSGVGDHVAARAALDDAIGRGVDAVRKLGAIVKNKYGDQPAKLAEWTSVSHTERASRRQGEPSAGVQAPAPTTGGQPPPPSGGTGPTPPPAG